MHGHHHGFFGRGAEQPGGGLVRPWFRLVDAEEFAGEVGVPVDAGVFGTVHDDGQREHGEDGNDVAFAQFQQGFRHVFPHAHAVPGAIELVAVFGAQLQRRMALGQFVEHGAVDLVGVLPGPRAGANLAQLFEHAPPPGEGELRVVHFHAAFGGEFAHRAARGGLPIEDAAADVEGQRLDFVLHALATSFAQR